MKNTGFFSKTYAVALAALLCVFALAECESDDVGGSDTAITFVSARQIDSAVEDSDTSARIRLRFDRDIPGLGASDVAVEWENKDAITILSLDLDPDDRGGWTYTLMLDGVTASKTITVKLAKTGYAFYPAFQTVTIVIYSGPPIDEPYNANIKDKFGVTGMGKGSVEAVFNTLHNFIAGDGLDALPDIIKLGDWIDLEGGITVEAYGGTDGMGGGDFNFGLVSEYRRLIVVGINSFRDGGSDGNSAYRYQGTEVPPDHVVFQFQNTPVNRRMNATGTTDGGYAECDMRKYLVPVGGDLNSGKFLTGLTNAGVPVGVLWAPKRYVAKGYYDDPPGTDEIIDLLWLPTEREIRGPLHAGEAYGYYSFADYETAVNQTWLEYYKKGYSRFWTSSTSYHPSAFCTSDGLNYADFAEGVVPAFCVR
jgi:hypothetical protein